MTRLEKLAIHLRRHHRTRLHPEVISEKNNIDVFTDSFKELLKIGQMNLDKLIEETVSVLRLTGQQHHKLVVAIKELADFKQVTSEQTDYSPVRLFSQPFCAFRQRLTINRTRRAGDRRPHTFIEGGRDRLQIVTLGERKIGLLKIQCPVRHVAENSAGFRPDYPATVIAFRLSPGRHKTWCAIRQCPRYPGFVIQRKAPTQLNGVHAKSVQHILIDNGQLLDYVINANRPGRQTQKLAQLRICDCRDAGRAVPGKVNGYTVRFTMV